MRNDLPPRVRGTPVPGNRIDDNLRLVGRDLDLRGIRTFILRCEKDLFIVKAGYQPPPAIMPITLHYESIDIDRLRMETADTNLASMRDFSNLSEILSAVGSYVSRKQGRLISVSNTASTPAVAVVIVKYALVRSDAVVEIFKGSAIYELCVSIYKTRSTPILSRPTRYTRFSDLKDMDSGVG
jgi:hypothetical protein